jgi:hypothetical protein
MVRGAGFEPVAEGASPQKNRDWRRRGKVCPAFYSSSCAVVNNVITIPDCPRLLDFCKPLSNNFNNNGLST